MVIFKNIFSLKKRFIFIQVSIVILFLLIQFSYSETRNSIYFWGIPVNVFTGTKSGGMYFQEAIVDVEGEDLNYFRKSIGYGACAGIRVDAHQIPVNKYDILSHVSRFAYSDLACSGIYFVPVVTIDCIKLGIGPMFSIFSSEIVSLKQLQWNKLFTFRIFRKEGNTIYGLFYDLASYSSDSIKYVHDGKGTMNTHNFWLFYTGKLEIQAKFIHRIYKLFGDEILISEYSESEGFKDYLILSLGNPDKKYLNKIGIGYSKYHEDRDAYNLNDFNKNNPEKRIFINSSGILLLLGGYNASSKIIDMIFEFGKNYYSGTSYFRIDFQLQYSYAD